MPHMPSSHIHLVILPQRIVYRVIIADTPRHLTYRPSPHRSVEHSEDVVRNVFARFCPGSYAIFLRSSSAVCIGSHAAVYTQGALAREVLDRAGKGGRSSRRLMARWSWCQWVAPALCSMWTVLCIETDKEVLTFFYLHNSHQRFAFAERHAFLRTLAVCAPYFLPAPVFAKRVGTDT